MNQGCRVIRDNHTLRRSLVELGRGDVMVGRLAVRRNEEYLFTDLLARGVHLIPSAIAQLASRSKVFQAHLFPDLMVPGTRIIHDLHDLMAAVNHYCQQGIGRVITKQEGKNGGIGVHLWHSGEDVFNAVSFGGPGFPFVLQPFVEAATDIRVILLGDYVEAYCRHNPHSFRHNLHCGGVSTHLLPIPEAYLTICRTVMERGGFPYAHVDLLASLSGDLYFSEINLRGGLRGSRIKATEYLQRVRVIHDQLLAEAVEGRKGDEIPPRAPVAKHIS